MAPVVTPEGKGTISVRPARLPVADIQIEVPVEVIDSRGRQGPVVNGYREEGGERDVSLGGLERWIGLGNSLL